MITLFLNSIIAANDFCPCLVCYASGVEHIFLQQLHPIQLSPLLQEQERATAIASAIILWEAIEESPILPSQYWKN